MGQATASRDEHQASIESLSAEIDQTAAAIETLKEEIAALSKEVAELQKALNEATELRAKEKESNEQTLADAADGAEAVEQAIKILKDFYGEGESLLQEPTETVADLAPKTWTGEYTGKVDSSKGIIGILEVILSDFQRTTEAVGAAESEAEAKFEQFKTDTEAEVEAKEASRTDKEGEVTD